MSNVRVRTAERRDLAWIAEQMREADKAEVKASGGYTPLEALQVSYAASSECYTAEISGLPVCMFGVAQDDALEQVGIPWLLGTPFMSNHRVAILRLGRQYVKHWLGRWEILGNYVHAENAKSIRWLKAIGFHIGAPEPHGVNGEDFCPFVIVRKVENRYV